MSCRSSNFINYDIIVVVRDSALEARMKQAVIIFVCIRISSVSFYKKIITARIRRVYSLEFKKAGM